MIKVNKEEMVSVFDSMKMDICKKIQKTKTITELKEKLSFILEEWDLSEEG